MDDPTAIAKDWLGRAQADHEIRLDVRRLALLDDHRPLANAMWTYVEGAAMNDLTPEQKQAVDYDKLASDWQALARQFSRGSPGRAV